MEQGFSLWSTIRAILTSPLLGRQKMPVSRCARLKNDRRGAKTWFDCSSSLSLFLFLSFSFFLSLSSFISIPRHPVIPLSLPLPLSRRRVVPPVPALENRNSISVALNFSELLFSSTVPFFDVQLAPPGLVRFTRGLCFVLL